MRIMTEFHEVRADNMETKEPRDTDVSVSFQCSRSVHVTQQGGVMKPVRHAAKWGGGHIQ
jgi:hypothetical protein